MSFFKEVIKIASEFKMRTAQIESESARISRILIRSHKEILSVMNLNKKLLDTISLNTKLWKKAIVKENEEESKPPKADKDKTSRIIKEKTLIKQTVVNNKSSNSNKHLIESKKKTDKSLKIKVEMKKLSTESKLLSKAPNINKSKSIYQSKMPGIAQKEKGIEQQLKEKTDSFSQNITKIQTNFADLKGIINGEKVEKKAFTKEDSRLNKIWGFAEKLQSVERSQGEESKEKKSRKEVKTETNRKETSQREKSEVRKEKNSKRAKRESHITKIGQSSIKNSKSKQSIKELKQTNNNKQKKERNSDNSKTSKIVQLSKFSEMLMKTSGGVAVQESGQALKTQMIGQLSPVITKYNQFNSEFATQYKNVTEQINSQMANVTTKANDKLAQISTGLTTTLSNKLMDLSEKYPKTTQAALYMGAGMVQANKVFNESRELYGGLIKRGVNLLAFFTSKTVAVGADTAATVANTGAEQVQYITKYKSTIITMKSTISTAKEIIVMKARLFALKAQSFATKAMAIAQAGLNAVMAANPIALAVIGIAALGAGLIFAYKKSERFRAVVNKVWQTIKKFWKVLMSNPIKNVAASLFTLVNPIGVAFKGLSKLYKIWQKMRGKKDKAELKSEISNDKTEKQKRKQMKLKQAKMGSEAELSNYKTQENYTSNNMVNSNLKSEISNDKTEKQKRKQMKLKQAKIGSESELSSYRTQESYTSNNMVNSNLNETNLSFLDKAGAVNSSSNKQNTQINNNSDSFSNDSSKGILIQNLEINVEGKNSEEIKQAVELGADELMRKLEELSNRIAIREKRLSYV